MTIIGSPCGCGSYWYANDTRPCVEQSPELDEHETSSLCQWCGCYLGIGYLLWEVSEELEAMALFMGSMALLADHPGTVETFRTLDEDETE